MSIDVIKPNRQEMLTCVARYQELNPVTTGLPDMQLEQCKRTFLSVLGFEQPRGDVQHSPFGNHVSPRISTQRTGYGAAFVRSRPGCGVLMHAHDTSECFMPMCYGGGVRSLDHVEIDAEENLDLVRALDIRRTPTVLFLGPTGEERQRASGQPRKADVVAALGRIMDGSGDVSI